MRQQQKDTHEIKETDWAQIREPEFGRVPTSFITRNVQMTSTYNYALIDDIDVVIKLSEIRMRNQSIGLCKKPRSRIRTPDVSDIPQNVLLVPNDVIMISFDVVVSIITS